MWFSCGFQIRALRVATEFKAQANAERKAGLPVSGFMDIQGKLNVFNVEVAKLNFNFISYVVEPLWSTYVDFFPELQPCLGGTAHCYSYSFVILILVLIDSPFFFFGVLDFSVPCRFR